MLYTINHDIHFRDSDGAVWIGDDESVDHINLTATTSRLLAYMLNRRGEVLTREDILNSVWVNYGLRSSNNSLNKYIADLRKLFIQLGIDSEVISTVPTIGFMFTRELVIEQVETSGDIYSSTPELNTPPDISLDKTESHSKKIILPHLFILFGFLVFGVILIFIFGNKVSSFFVRGNINPQQDGYVLGRVNGCEIFTLKQTSKALKDIKIAIAKDIINKSKLNCLSNAKIFFQPSDSVVYGSSGRVFISRCTFNKDDIKKFAGCKSYYEKSYRYEG